MVEWVRAHPQFLQFFQPVGTLGENLDQPVEMGHDPRLPAEVLFVPDAEKIFRHHLGVLEAEFRRKRMQEDFEQLLSECTQVTPGKPLSDVRIFFLGKESFEALPDADAQEIYERYQRQLVKKARLDFVELLLENVEEFISRILFRRNTNSAGSTNALAGLTEQDMREIHDKLQEDIKYRQLNRLYQARDNMICQYASFVSYPLRQHCPAGPRCVDSLVEQILANRISRPNMLPVDFSTDCDSSQQGNTTNGVEPEGLNLGVLGAPGLPDQLVREIRLYLPHDLYPDAPIGGASSESHCIATNLAANGENATFSSDSSGDQSKLWISPTPESKGINS